MSTLKNKIGYSDIGGIFIGKNIQSDYHKNHLITIIISFGEPFEIWQKKKNPELYEAVLVQKNTKYKLRTGEKDDVLFIHLDPYTEMGLHLSQQEQAIQRLNTDLFEPLHRDFRSWQESSENTMQETEELLNRLYQIISSTDSELRKIDERILECIQFVKQNDSERIALKQMAKLVHLSESRFAHLFKKETGITFRQFVLHNKLVKSLQAIYKNHNLTESTFIGGFADQSHFSKTFKHSFGIKPSKSKR